MALYDYGSNYGYDCCKKRYPDTRKCLKRFKELVEEQSLSETDKLFRETIQGMRYTYKTYREAIRSRDRDIALSKKLQKEVNCLECNNAYNFNCPRCKCLNYKRKNQVDKIVCVEDRGLALTEQALKQLIDSRFINENIRDLNFKYADCVDIKDEPYDYCKYDKKDYEDSCWPEDIY